MDNKLTQKIKQWLEASESDRDYMAGALMVLQLSGNKIMYRNMVANIDAHHEDVEYQLQKYYNFRVAELTHEQVIEMESQVCRIAEEHGLDDDQPKPRGKRDDHDALPDDIKDIYEKNIEILQEMAELHLRLRLLSTENSTCPDSERFPFLKELIALDKVMHSNWEKYDTYKSPRKRTSSKTTK